jgi:hypothetical protein
MPQTLLQLLPLTSQEQAVFLLTHLLRVSTLQELQQLLPLQLLQQPAPPQLLVPQLLMQQPLPLQPPQPLQLMQQPAPLQPLLLWAGQRASRVKAWGSAPPQVTPLRASVALCPHTCCCWVGGHHLQQPRVVLAAMQQCI